MAQFTTGIDLPREAPSERELLEGLLLAVRNVKVAQSHIEIYNWGLYTKIIHVMQPLASLYEVEVELQGLVSLEENLEKIQPCPCSLCQAKRSVR